MFKLLNAVQIIMIIYIFHNVFYVSHGLITSSKNNIHIIIIICDQNDNRYRYLLLKLFK